MVRCRARARQRTTRWDRYLEGARLHHLDPGRLACIGLPPPLEAGAVWAGRQVALLKDGRTIALGEIQSLNRSGLTLLAPAEPGDADTLLIRDATRTASGLLESAQPFATPLAAAPTPAGSPPPVDAGPGQRLLGRVGAVDTDLVNGVFGDPLLHLRIRHLGRSLLFDLGDGSRLSARVAHQVSDVFVSHAHMDHLGGFQWLLRSRLGDFPPCRLYGPPGLARHIQCFMEGFLWDRIGDKGPVFEVLEIHGRRLQRVRLQAGRQGAEPLATRPLTDGVLLREPGFLVRSVQLDHHTPVFAYALELASTLNVRKDRLRARGLRPGPWLTELKRRLLADQGDAVIRLPDGSGASAAALGDELVLTTPGKTLVYATDLADTADNRQRLVTLARNAHTLYCEAAFSEADAANARRNGHLTTRAAGEIASLARVSRLIPFHFSRRYQNDPQRLYDELEAACPRVVRPAS